MPHRRGIIFILSAPSGAGKTTISRGAIRRIGGLEPSISLTTRAPRNGEADGVDYHFVSEDDFNARVTRKALAEHARVFDFSYGTPREPLDAAVAGASDILLDIDIQGARQIRAKYSSDSVTIFVLPPSFAELEGRLRGRGTDSDAAIAHRLRRAREEAAAFAEYDYLLINERIDDSISQLAGIVGAERLKVGRLGADFSPWKS